MKQALDQTSENEKARQATQTGRIVVVRHGQPDRDREAKPRLTAQQYKDWWASYERASLKDNGQGPSVKLLRACEKAPFLFSSIRPRAFETAQAIAQGREIRQNEVFVEAPLPPPEWSEKRKYLPKTWNKIARVSWLMGHAGGEESQDEARLRADKAAQILVETAEQGHDVVLAAHGWFNRMLRPELKRRGWKCIHDGGDSYWSHRIYEKRI